MTPINSAPEEQLVARVKRFIALPAELPWLEFKVNKLSSGAEIAKYACALGNSARLHDEPAGYLIWGVNDDHAVVGTSFDWQQAKAKGNEDLLPWLNRVISPAPDVTFDEVTVDGHLVVLLRIPAALSAPYSFEGKRYFRKGSYMKILMDFPNEERQLWTKLNQFEFENTVVAEGLEPESITDLLDPEAFFLNRPELPHTTGTALIDTLRNAKAISYSHEQGWHIPAWSALMYARSLQDFPELRGRAPRVLYFNGPSRTAVEREWEFTEGYASSFTHIVTLFNTIRPGGEHIDPSGKRVVTPLLPTVAFREVLANALMHQDLEQRGRFLTVEIFSDRVEVTNPGTPLIDPQRFIDSASTTRNTHLGEALRLAHLVEQRGSGWDKIVSSLETEHFPPALVRANGSTTVSLSAYRPFALMTMEEKTQAVYQHACLRFLENLPVNNSSIRQRFGLKDSQAAQATRLLAATVEEGLIHPYDPSAGPRSLRYVPFWSN
ncbi:putative DNA-binding protein [Corynebacterium striatum]|uniref:Transcriptional regulator n=1 Tax=Corynebacterium striatum TaxID=43770 RepID=A0AAQ1Z6R0_CORST|nr:RNA-binding domain-containing protein [Corynebacterium striatum]QQE52813.1 putative DNA binding domain-containing protein [Corynebacterium striatum]GEA42982.1 transcriptional regulator [Corynebacterium striatum]STD61281.1 putative DNA-binding protein [Corynebacterium striatum]